MLKPLYFRKSAISATALEVRPSDAGKFFTNICKQEITRNIYLIHFIFFVVCLKTNLLLILICVEASFRLRNVVFKYILDILHYLILASSQFEFING